MASSIRPNAYIRPPGPDETILHEIVRHSPGLRDTTKRSYLSDVDAWVAFAGRDPANWTRYTAQKFYTSLCARMQTRSANRVMATMTYVAGWWAKKENNPQLDFSVVQKARAEDTDEEAPSKALTEEEAQRLLAKILEARARDPLRVARDVALVVVALETGMRRMSLESMRLQTTAPRGDHLVTSITLKGYGTPYPVALSETAGAALAPWRKVLADLKITTGCVWRSIRHTGTVRIGTGFTAQAIYDVVRKYSDQVGIELTPHTFRHTFISWRLAAGWSPQQVAAITGHQLPSTGGLLVNLGAMHRYVDPAIFWPTVSSATPAWLRRFVQTAP